MYGCWRCMSESCKWPWWSWLVLLAIMVVVAHLLQPRRRPNKTARIAYARLMHITGLDRIRCRDGRVIWYGESK